jgi:chromate transport protein ChrA
VSPGGLFLDLMLGVMGFALLRYGKKNSRMPQLAIGLALMIMPWAVSSILLELLIAAGLLGLLWFLVRQGL